MSFITLPCHTVLFFILFIFKTSPGWEIMIYDYNVYKGIYINKIDDRAGITTVW